VQVKKAFGLIGIQLLEKYKENFDVSNKGSCIYQSEAFLSGFVQTGMDPA
jgi:hypothetical protein